MKTGKKYLIVIVGPTGIGKTDVSIKLAKKFQCSILSADSRQMYKEMFIGTATPSKEEIDGVKHYFIQNLSVEDYYNASEYETDVLKVLETEFQERDIAILVGGSMMYIDAVCKGIDELPTIDSKLRQEILDKYDQEGIAPIRHQLKLLDPEYYGIVDLKNDKRILHAVEICLMTGQKYSDLRTNKVKERDFEMIKIGLDIPREELYDRINLRVDKMVEAGLVEEVKGLLAKRGLNALKTVGYREIFSYLDGNGTLEQAIEEIKKNSRRYAKRQLSWFRRDESVHWFAPMDVEQIKQKITQKINF